MTTDGVPERGDVVWLSLDPSKGHEQSGRRPALTLSPVGYNGRVGLGQFAPITNKGKGYPFEVPLPTGLDATGVVLADQMKNLDWRSRNPAFICHVSDEVVNDVVGRVLALIDPDGEFGPPGSAES